jgi:DNA-binding transcriptional regulator/RsmH inhibitor MraZ
MEIREMLLTKQKLNNILRNYRVQIPAKFKKDLLEQYGNTVMTEDGRTIEYSEQDICEQLRKIVCSHGNVNKEVK